MEAVFAAEGGPWGVERDQFDRGCEAREKRSGVSFGEKGDPGVFGRNAQERDRESEVAEAP